MDEIFEQLAEPFSPKLVKWRAGSTTKDKSRTMLLAYIDARHVYDRLDMVVGTGNWETHFEEMPSGRVICRLTVYFKVDGVRVPITKSDASWVPLPPPDAHNLDTKHQQRLEMEQKGVFSEALKRAAVHFGIGRYLYNIEGAWIDTDELEYGGKPPKSWLQHTAPQLLPTYRPSIFKTWQEFTLNVLEHSESILKIREWLDNDDLESAKAEYQSIPNEDWLAINRSYTRGGVFTTEQNAKIKRW